jgi:hypothetical protein
VVFTRIIFLRFFNHNTFFHSKLTPSASGCQIAVIPDYLCLFWPDVIATNVCTKSCILFGRWDQVKELRCARWAKLWLKSALVLGAFAKLRKATISFVMSVCVCVYIYIYIVVPCRLTDMTNLIIAFRNFANAHKIEPILIKR